MATSLQKVTEVAEDVVRATKAIAELSAGKNGANVAQLVRILEKQVRQAVAGRIKARRRADKQRRGSGGRFAR